MKEIRTAAFSKVSQMFHAKVGDFALIARGGETPNDEIQFTSPSQAAVEQEKQKVESQVQGPGVQEEDEFFQTMQPVTYEVRQLGPEDANLIKQYNMIVDADNFDGNRQAEQHYEDGFNSVPMSSDIDDADYHIKREKEEGGAMASSYFNLIKTAGEWDNARPEHFYNKFAVIEEPSGFIMRVAEDEEGAQMLLAKEKRTYPKGTFSVVELQPEHDNAIWGYIDGLQEEEREAEEEARAFDHDNMMDGDNWQIDGVGFADPGGNSALRAETPNNPRNLPCPNCGQPNKLTPLDQQRGYQCDDCADRAEGHYGKSQSYFSLTKAAQFSGDENYGDDITSGPINQDYQDFMREYEEGKHRTRCPQCGMLMEAKNVLNPSNPTIYECNCGHRFNPEHIDAKFKT